MDVDEVTLDEKVPRRIHPDGMNNSFNRFPQLDVARCFLQQRLGCFVQPPAAGFQLGFEMRDYLLPRSSSKIENRNHVDDTIVGDLFLERQDVVVSDFFRKLVNIDSSKSRRSSITKNHVHGNQIVTVPKDKLHLIRVQHPVRKGGFREGPSHTITAEESNRISRYSSISTGTYPASR